MNGFNIEAAIELYYSQNELGNKEICRIFGCSNSRASSLKKQVTEHAAKAGDHPVVFEAKNVNCEYAFTVWGLNIGALEKKYKKLQNFRQLKGEDAVCLPV